jgi:hypothetical protein
VEAEVQIHMAVATTSNIRHLKFIEIPFRVRTAARAICRLFDHAGSNAANDQCGGAT